MSQPSQTDEPSTSAQKDLSDLDILNFPGDVDWSSTLVLRCDPENGPYKLVDITTGLYDLVRRNDVFTLGPTVLNHAFILSFKSTHNLEHFVRFMRHERNPKELLVKGRPCVITRVPNPCVTVNVRNIPIEVDTSHIVNALKPYGTIVKTELVKSKFRGWFNVYTNERKFSMLLHEGITADNIPFGLNVKGLIASVSVEEREPKCLECYYSGHTTEDCQYRGCILYSGN